MALHKTRRTVVYEDWTGMRYITRHAYSGRKSAAAFHPSQFSGLVHRHNRDRSKVAAELWHSRKAVRCVMVF